MVEISKRENVQTEGADDFVDARPTLIRQRQGATLSESNQIGENDMNNFNKLLLAAGLAGILVTGFQNCGSKNFDAGTATNNSANPTAAAAGTNGSAQNGSGSSVVGIVASGNTVTNLAGQSLSFVNNQGASIGNVSVSNGKTGSSGYVLANLFSPLAGRQATVKIMLDPNTGKFLSVNQSSATPYMCHDQSVNACVNYPNLTSGQQESNCNSPIYFQGALNGSVNNLTDTAWTTFCSNAQANLCQEFLSGGARSSTAGISKADCTANCRLNANNNPNETMTCLYNGNAVQF